MVSSSIRIAALIVVTAFSLNTTRAQDAEPLALITGVNGREDGRCRRGAG